MCLFISPFGVKTLLLTLPTRPGRLLSMYMNEYRLLLPLMSSLVPSPICESRLLIFHFYYIQSILIQRGLCVTPRIKIKPDKRSHGSSCKLVEGWEWGGWELFPGLHLLHWNASLSPSLQNTADKVNTKLTYLLSCPPLFSQLPIPFSPSLQWPYTGLIPANSTSCPQALLSFAFFHVIFNKVT